MDSLAPSTYWILVMALDAGRIEETRRIRSQHEGESKRKKNQNKPSIRDEENEEEEEEW